MGRRLRRARRDACNAMREIQDGHKGKALPCQATGSSSGSVLSYDDHDHVASRFAFYTQGGSGRAGSAPLLPFPRVTPLCST